MGANDDECISSSIQPPHVPDSESVISVTITAKSNRLISWSLLQGFVMKYEDLLRY